MRIGLFVNEKDKKVMLLLQRVPQDVAFSEDNYPGTSPEKRIKEIEAAGYKVFAFWWADIKDDMDAFKKKVMQFQNSNYRTDLQ